MDGSGTAVTAGYQPLLKMQEKAAQLKQELDALGKGEKHAQFKRRLSVVVGEGRDSGSGVSMARRFPKTPSHGIVGGLLPAEGSSRPGTATSRPTSAMGLAGTGMRSRRSSVASTITLATEHSVDADNFPKTPGGRRFGMRSPSRRNADLQDAYHAAIARQNHLEDVVADLTEQARNLAADNEQRQESYMRREEQLKAEVARLEDALRVAKGERPTNPAFGKATENIKELHSLVVGKIEELLDAQATTIRAEEHTTLRRFATRLNELEAQVAAERGAPSKAEGEWMEKTIALRQELSTTQEIATILDKKYQVLCEENGRLKAQFKLQEEDREYLIKQQVALKRENAALRNQVAALLGDVSALTEEREELLSGLGRAASAGTGGQSTGGAAGGMALSGLGGPDRDAVSIKIQRYEEVIDSLKQLLEAERRRTKAARASHMLELQQRTQVQTILRQCIEDVRDKRRTMEAQGARQQQVAERATARSRPLSARPPTSVTTVGAAARPISAVPARVPSFNSQRMPTRPLSAMPVHSTALPGRGVSASGSDGGGTVGPGDTWAGDGSGERLSPRSREALVEALLTHEELLKLVFDKGFPGVSPHPPNDPLLDKMVAWQDQRDAQVVANAKVLAAAKTGAAVPASALRDATPGGMLAKEAAGRPWVLNVDAMLSEFLQGGPSGSNTRR